MIFESLRPMVGNGGDTTGQAIARAEASLGLGSNAGKLLRVDIPDTWEAPREVSTGLITAVADAEDDEHVIVSSAGHPLQDGDTVTITGTTDYDGDFVVSSCLEGSFEIVATWGVTQEGAWAFTPEYYSPELLYKQIDEGLYVSRFYFGGLEDADTFGPEIDELLGVHFVVSDTTEDPSVTTSPSRGRFVKGAEFASIDEVDGVITATITVTTSTLAISSGWVDVMVAGD